MSSRSTRPLQCRMRRRALLVEIKSTRLCRYQSSQASRSKYLSGTTSFWEATNPLAKDASMPIAVLGGGISGLTVAYLISKFAPKAQIDLFEHSDRFGGWLQSTRERVRGEDIVFEHGPRSFRPALGTAEGYATIDLISSLNLTSEVVLTPKSAPAAQNRFLYYADRLNILPNLAGKRIIPGLKQLYRDSQQPVFRGTVLPLFLEIFKPPRSSTLHDESIGSFFRRRFSAATAENLVSAVMAGIYAGDIEKLSIKSVMPAMWLHDQSFGGVTGGVLRNAWSRRTWVKQQDLVLLLLLVQKDMDEIRDLQLPLADKFELWLDELSYLKSFKSSRALIDQETYQRLSAVFQSYDEITQRTQKLKPFAQSSIYTFKNGVEELSRSLVSALEKNPNVTLHRNTTITGLRPVSSSTTGLKRKVWRTLPGLTQLMALKIEVTRKAPGGGVTKTHYAYAASALPAPSLLAALEATGTISSQEVSHFAVPSVTVMVVNLYYMQSNLAPVKGFGYLIPRSVPIEQNPERALGVVFDSDAVSDPGGAPGTKLTVMLGGYLWDGVEDLPSEKEGITMAQNVVANHLGITAEPVAAKAKLQKDCIPQYIVGHEDKTHAFRALLEEKFEWTFDILGASWDGVAVNQCIKSAYLAAQRFQHGLKQPSKPFPWKAIYKPKPSRRLKTKTHQEENR